jgi:hypothetical protein
MKWELGFVILCLAAVFSLGFSAAENQPANSTGTLSSTGVVASLSSEQSSRWSIIIDGAGGAGIGTAAISVLTSPNGAYEPLTTPAYNAIAVTATTTVLESIQGPLYGVQVSLTAYVSGTIRASIIAN